LFTRTGRGRRCGRRRGPPTSTRWSREVCGARSPSSAASWCWPSPAKAIDSTCPWRASPIRNTEGTSSVTLEPMLPSIPLHGRALFGLGALGDQVVDVVRPVLDGRCSGSGRPLDDDLHDPECSESRVDRGGAALRCPKAPSSTMIPLLATFSVLTGTWPSRATQRATPLRLRRGLHRPDILLGLAALAVVEIIVKKGGRCRYTTIQNWSNNVYNLVTKARQGRRGRDHGVDRRQHRLQGHHEVPLGVPDGRARQGRGAVVGLRGEGQHQDAGAKMVHLAPHHLLDIVSKSVARGGGAPPTAAWSGEQGAHQLRLQVKCDALLVDQISRSDTYPYVDVREDDVSMATRRPSPR